MQVARFSFYILYFGPKTKSEIFYIYFSIDLSFDEHIYIYRYVNNVICEHTRFYWVYAHLNIITLLNIKAYKRYNMYGLSLGSYCFKRYLVFLRLC